MVQTSCLISNQHYRGWVWELNTWNYQWTSYPKGPSLHLHNHVVYNEWNWDKCRSMCPWCRKELRLHFEWLLCHWPHIEKHNIRNTPRNLDLAPLPSNWKNHKLIQCNPYFHIPIIILLHESPFSLLFTFSYKKRNKLIKKAKIAGLPGLVSRKEMLTLKEISNFPFWACNTAAWLLWRQLRTN